MGADSLTGCEIIGLQPWRIVGLDEEASKQDLGTLLVKYIDEALKQDGKKWSDIDLVNVVVDIKKYNRYTCRKETELQYIFPLDLAIKDVDNDT